MATIYGTQGNDSLQGTLDDDTISGLSGNDTLVGLAGNDLLTADQQSLTGSTAGVNYMVNPGIRPDEDVVIGGSGNDTLVGGVGSYTLADYSTVLSDSAGAATQGIVVNMQAGTVVDNWGNTDTLLSVDAIKGSPLADLFTASSTLRSNFDGGDGNDTLVGGNHWDDLRGGAGNDSLSGGGEDDSLAGGPGNDLLDGSAGLYDLADYSAFYDPTNGYILHGVVANLTTGLATDGWGGTDTLLGIEVLDGSALSDNFTGDGGNNYLYGNDGNDFLTALAGDDWLYDGTGNDSVIGGPGNDYFTGSRGTDTLDGGSGADDWLDYSYTNGRPARTPPLWIQTYDPSLDPIQGLRADLLTGVIVDAWGDRDSVLNIEHVTGTSFVDVLNGNGAANRFDGGYGADQLKGYGGNDTLIGGAGFDTAYYDGLQANYTITQDAQGVTVSGAEGVDVLTGIESIRFGASELLLVDAKPFDFNRDGNSDLLWSRPQDGYRYLWGMEQNARTSGAALEQLGPNLVVQAVGDFNGDGTSDILLKDTITGQFTINSGFSYPYGVVGTSYGINLTSPTLNWNVVGAGDFNNNRTDDLVWRDSNTGQLYLWMMQNNAIASSVSLGVIGTDWNVAAIGDFNGDATSDLALRNSATGQVYLWNFSNGALSGGRSLGEIGAEWQIAGAGDFNADGTSDIAWRNSNDGTLYLWMMQNNAVASPSNLGAIGTDWSIETIVDLNADNSSDLVLKNSGTGQFYIWNINGGAVSGGVDLGTIGADWQLV